MKAVFNLLAVVMGILGAFYLYLFFTSFSLLDLISMISGFFMAYAWSLIGDMWERMEHLEQKVQ